MHEVRDSGMLQSILINSRREYMLHHQQQFFDEVPVRLVLLDPLQGVTYVLKNERGNLSTGGGVTGKKHAKRTVR